MTGFSAKKYLRRPPTPFFSAKSYHRRPPTPFFSLNPTIGGLRHHFFRQILPSEASDAIFFTKPYRRRPPAMVFRRATRSNDFFS